MGPSRPDFAIFPALERSLEKQGDNKTDPIKFLDTIALVVVGITANSSKKIPSRGACLSDKIIRVRSLRTSLGDSQNGDKSVFNPLENRPIMNIDVFSTRLGWACAVGTHLRGASAAEKNATLLQLSLGCKTRESALERIRPEYLKAASYETWYPELTEAVQAYAEGDPIDFRAIRIDLAHLTDFGRRVINACRRIPYGQTVTYAELAARADSPNAARAVGSRMAANRTILVVPCHRVVGSDDTLGGFSGPGGIGFKKKLLELEQR